MSTPQKFASRPELGEPFAFAVPTAMLFLALVAAFAVAASGLAAAAADRETVQAPGGNESAMVTQPMGV